ALINVNGFTGTYDGVPHGASASFSLAGGGNFDFILSLGNSFTNAPGGIANWSFAGGTNYNNASGSVTIYISKADALLNVSGFTGAYTATAHGAAGSAAGVGGIDLNAQLNLGDSYTNAPGGTANWSFAGGTNYHNASGAVNIDISKADALLNVSGFSGTYTSS